MDQKTQKKRAIYAAIAMLLVSAIVMTTASFAWFTLGKNVSVKELDLKVTAKEGISISANTKEFTNVLSIEDLNGTSDTAWRKTGANVNVFPTQISPASSNFNASGSTFPSFFKGGIDTNAEGNQVMTAEAVAEEDAPLYAFDVYVNYPGAQADLRVNVGDSLITVKDDANDGTVKNEEAVAAMRLGFVNCGVVTSETGASISETLVYNHDDDDIGSTRPVTSAGESASLGKDVYNVTDATRGSLTLGNYSKSTNQNSEAQLVLHPGVNRVRVYIWMEGQDANCTDKLFSQLIGANLVFKMA